MKNRYAMTIFALLLLAAAAIYPVVADSSKVRNTAAQSVSAADDGPLSRPFAQLIFERVARELDLSEAQQTEIKTIINDEFANAKPLLQKLGENRRQLKAVTANGQFDEAQVRSLAAQQAQVVMELIVAKERAKAKIYQQLTPDQRAKADEMLERLGQPHGGPFHR